MHVKLLSKVSTCTCLVLENQMSLNISTLAQWSAVDAVELPANSGRDLAENPACGCPARPRQNYGQRSVDLDLGGSGKTNGGEDFVGGARDCMDSAGSGTVARSSDVKMNGGGVHS